MGRSRAGYPLSSKNVLITGASRGLGRALAHAFAREGARVTLLGRDERALQRVRDQLRHSTHTQPELLVCDLRAPNQVERAAARALERCGPIDVLVNNAGIIHRGSALAAPLAHYAEAMAVHFWAPLALIRALIPGMRQRGGGRIVNVSSVEGKVAFPQLAPSCASKFALTGLSDVLRAELARDRIFVTTVLPTLLRAQTARDARPPARGLAALGSTIALQLLAVSHERAAQRIVTACRAGQGWLALDLLTRGLIGAEALAPNLVGALLERVNELMYRRGASPRPS